MIKRIDYDAIGGRRFVMAMGCGIVSTVLVWFGKLTGTEFQMIVLGTVGIYVAGNTTQKVKAPVPGVIPQ